MEDVSWLWSKEFITGVSIAVASLYKAALEIRRRWKDRQKAREIADQAVKTTEAKNTELDFIKQDNVDLREERDRLIQQLADCTQRNGYLWELVRGLGGAGKGEA